MISCFASLASSGLTRHCLTARISEIFTLTKACNLIMSASAALGKLKMHKPSRFKTNSTS